MRDFLGNLDSVARNPTSLASGLLKSKLLVIDMQAKFAVPSNWTGVYAKLRSGKAQMKIVAIRNWVGQSRFTFKS
jgi:hypothetical protein